MTRPRPSGWLLRRIPPRVASAPGGGCSRAELAAALGARADDPVFDVSLLACYARRQVDFCWGYVVVPRKPADARIRGIIDSTGRYQPTEGHAA